MAQLDLPCLACEHFDLGAGGGGFAVISLVPVCELGLDPEPTDEDPIGCSEFACLPEIQEKLEIGQAVEELIRNAQEREADTSGFL